MILVINDNADAVLKPYAERYKLFALNDQRRAIEHALAIGFGDGGFIQPRFSLAPGVMNIWMCGDVSVKLIVLDVQQ